MTSHERGSKPARVEVADDGSMLRVLLRCSGRAAALAGRLGADRAACQAILEARLRIDMRAGGMRNPQNPDKGGLWITCLAFLFTGLVVAGAVAFLEPDATRAMAAVQGFAMVMIGMLLVTDYLPSLIDPAESHLLAPRPVSGRTLLLTRIAHFMLYMAVPVSCLLLPSWLVGFAREDTLTWMLAFPVLSVLMGMLMMSALMIAFLVALQRLDGERLSTILLRAQIISSFVIFGGYYLAIGLMQNEKISAWMAGDHVAQVLLPPYWFGGCFGLLEGRTDALAWVLAAAAVIVPVVSMVTMLRLAGPRLATGLASLEHGGSDVPAGRGFITRWAQRLVSPGLEQAGFDVFLALSRREKGFKSRVYPILVVPFVMFLWFSLSKVESGPSMMLSGSVLPLLYGIIILMQVRFSDTPGAAWVFGAAPLARPGLYVAGVIKGVAFAFLLPWMVLVLVAGKLMAQDVALMDVVFGTLATVTLLLVVARSVARSAFPFSRQFTTKQAQNMGLMMMGFLLVGALMAAQTGLKALPGGQEVGAVVLVPVVLWLARRLRDLQMDRGSLPVV